MRLFFKRQPQGSNATAIAPTMEREMAQSTGVRQHSSARTLSDPDVWDDLCSQGYAIVRP